MCVQLLFIRWNYGPLFLVGNLYLINNQLLYLLMAESPNISVHLYEVYLDNEKDGIMIIILLLSFCFVFFSLHSHNKVI